MGAENLAPHRYSNRSPSNPWRVLYRLSYPGPFKVRIRRKSWRVSVRVVRVLTDAWPQKFRNSRQQCKPVHHTVRSQLNRDNDWNWRLRIPSDSHHFPSSYQALLCFVRTGVTQKLFKLWPHFARQSWQWGQTTLAFMPYLLSLKDKRHKTQRNKIGSRKRSDRFYNVMCMHTFCRCRGSDVFCVFYPLEPKLQYTNFNLQ
jgi:hypothetical protein